MAANNTTKTSTHLTWQEPANDGGSPVTGYYVERKASYNKRFTKVNKEALSDLKLNLDDLSEGEVYEIRVAAENAAGIGEFCEPIEITAKDPYGKSRSTKHH